jgi:hypothetical protein
VARFARVDIGGILQRPNVANQIVLEEARLMAEEVGQFGAERMRQYIKDRGTRFSAAAAAAGVNRGPGRIRTGNMYNSVDSRVESGTAKVSSAFGWIRNFEQYFEYQETGFRNKFIAAYTASGNLRVVNGGPIIRRNPFGGYKNTPGMFALRDSRADVQAEMPRLLKKYKARITRRINKA